MKHGANIYKYASKIGCKPRNIVDFSSNINLYNPKLNLKLTNDIVVKYPDANYKKLKKAVSKKYSIKNSQIAFYNGATTAIYELFKTIKTKDVYLYAPLYGEYEKAIDANIIKIDRFKNLYAKVAKNSTVVFVNPSTPDGRYYELDELFAHWVAQNCTIILDESFLEFEQLKSFRDKIESYDKLYIIQSFSKFHSCAGVRIGAIFSNKNNIKNLKTPLWHLSALDAKLLTKKLLDKKFKSITHKLHKKQKKELLGILEQSGLFEDIYKSDANFFLVKCKDAKGLFLHLLKHKILVRTCGSFDHLNDQYIRFAVKTKKAHKVLKKALKKFGSDV